MTTPITYDNPRIGCYLDHGNRNASELSADIIKLAMEYGYQPDETDSALLTCWEQQWLNDEALQFLDEASNDAIEYLNGLETRSFLYWANDGYAGAFGLWPNVDGAREDVGFVSVKSHADARRLNIETDPDDSAYPPTDYQGEWLHVSDHGNCTLYVRQNGQDKEIWSCV